MAKLSKERLAEMVPLILAKYTAGGSQYTIAHDFGVHQKTIHRIMVRYGIGRRHPEKHPEICRVASCEKPSRRAGLCRMHHTRLLRYGGPECGPRPKAEPFNYLVKEVLPFAGNACLDWPYSRNGQGYGMVCVDGKPWLVSRYVCQQIWGQPPTKTHHAAHTCGRGHHGCCNPNHLIWKTPKANNADKVAHGTANRGEKNRFAKITASDVLTIRALAGRKRHKDIAAMFGISRTNVGHIVHRDTWNWLPDAYSTTAIQREAERAVA